MNFKIITVALALAAVAVYCQPLRAQTAKATRVEIWSTQNLEQPLADEAAVELFVRVNSRGYVTLYQIDPGGALEIIYPKSHHCWRALESNRVYRLSELAEDTRLEYKGVDGSAYVGGIFTAQAMHIVPWLEQSFSAQGLSSGKRKSQPATFDAAKAIAAVETDIQFRLGANARPAFAVAPLHIQPRQAIAGEIPSDSPAFAPAASPQNSLMPPSSSTPVPFTLQPNPSPAVSAFEKQGKSQNSLRGKGRDSLATPFKPRFKLPAPADKSKKPQLKPSRSTEKQSTKKTRERN